jgi:hypothetical protein
MANKIKIGYHYTSLSNWEKILKKGYMIPYHIENDGILTAFPDGVNGIWLWENNPKGLSHAGNIFLQASRKAETQVVKLRVYYREENRLTYGEGKSRVKFTQTSSIGNLVCPKENALIYTEPIPVGDIELMGVYDLVEGLRKETKIYGKA